MWRESFTLGDKIFTIEGEDSEVVGAIAWRLMQYYQQKESQPVSKKRPEISQRIGDAERQKVFDHLSDAMTLGYLGVDEFEERMDLVMRARTSAALQRAVRDLKNVSHPPTAVERQLEKLERSKTKYQCALIVTVFVMFAAIIMVIALASMLPPGR